MFMRWLTRSGSEAADSSSSRAVPQGFNAASGGSSTGSLGVSMPSTPKEVAERERDFSRAFVGGSIAVLASSKHVQVLPRPERRSSETGEEITRNAGNVNNDVVHALVSDFREQLIDVAFEEVRGIQLAQLRETAEAGHIVAQLTIGPALDFTISTGLTPRILQPTFVVVVGPESVRVAMLGFVGDLVIGSTPTEQRTPFVARLLTDNLIPRRQEDTSQLNVSYVVRRVTDTETTIAACVAAELPALEASVQCKRMWRLSEFLSEPLKRLSERTSTMRRSLSRRLTRSGSRSTSSRWRTQQSTMGPVGSEFSTCDSIPEARETE